MTKDDFIVGDIIQRYRELNGLTRIELAEKLNVSSKLIEKYEYHETMPPYPMLKKLNKVLDIPILEFFGLKDDTKGFAANLDEKLSRFSAVKKLEQNPELLKIINYYSNHSDKLRSAKFINLMLAIARVPDVKRKKKYALIMKLLKD